jgi:DNA-binding winged helix-turn-helix (wHTH) protein/tetratricopeptide (TPR) repeat protein
MPGHCYRFGDFTLSTRARELKRAGVPVPLSPRAFDCLVYLIEQRERAVNKDELVEAIWGRPNVSDTQLGQTVLRARRAVGDDGQVQHFIRTVSRFGYRWIAEVQIADGDEANPVGEAAREAAPQPAQDRIHAGGENTEPVRPPRGRRPLVAAALGVLVMTAGAAFVLRNHFVPEENADPNAANAIVLPLRVDSSPEQAWLRLGAMDLIADRLREGGMTVLPSDNVVALLRAAHGADPALLRRNAPSAWLVDGSFQVHDGTWAVELHANAADGSRIGVESAQPQPLDAAREAADRLLGRLGRAHPAAPAGGTPMQERLQRAQAAMLANDLDEARAILVSDPELAHAEPQLGYRLAQVDFRAGEYKRAETSLNALLAEPAANDPLFHARLLNARGGVRIRMDEFADAEHDYDDAITLLRGSSHAPELGLALTGRGVSRGMRHAFADALADLGEARVQLQAAGDVLAVARVDSNLGGLEMIRDRPEQALGYLESAATRFEEYGAINELMETLESLVSANLALLRPADALTASDRSWTLRTHVSDPNQRLNIVLDRSDALLAAGRLSEASRLLAGLPETAADANPFLTRRLPALRARLAFAEGRYGDAASAAQHALALPPPSDDKGEGIAEIALVGQRAQFATASALAHEAAPHEAAPTYPVQAVLAAEQAAAAGDGAAAERDYRTALDLAEKRGVPSDVALATGSYGPWLLQQGRLEQATEIIGRVSPWADRDYGCALLQVRLFHALGKTEAWAAALRQARALAGERTIPEALLKAPQRSA